jgi:hypothetical protein
MCSVLWSNFKQKKQQQQAQTTATPVAPINENYKAIVANKMVRPQKQNNVSL